MKLISVTEMQDLETAANTAGYSYAEMMKTAGVGIAEKVDQLYRENGATFALGLVGGGNNGGDTLVALTALQKAGWCTRAILAKDRKKEDPLLALYTGSGGVVMDGNAIAGNNSKTGIILDGIFGTGFRPPLDKNIITLLAKVKQSLPECVWIAVDCPSGMDCIAGEVSAGTVKADVTICLEAVKQGMLTYTAFPYLGELITVDLGISRFIQATGKPSDTVVTKELVREILPQRTDLSHKGSFGKTLVVGGCVNYPGAPVLAGLGAYAVGAGLVKIGVPASIYQTALASSLELTWVVLEDAGGVISEIAVETVMGFAIDSQCLVIGPGIGREETTRRFLNNLLTSGSESKKSAAGFPGIDRQVKHKSPGADLPPLVIDADGLNLLARLDDWSEKLVNPAVLTPHPGEMARLTGLSIDEIQKDRAGNAKKFADAWGQIVVLKGPLTAIAAPGGKSAVIPIATSSLSKAGTGDVLAGMIGGLIAQGLSTWNAALAGAWLHASAGLAASAAIGCNESVLASDVVRAVAQVYHSL